MDSWKPACLWSLFAAFYNDVFQLSPQSLHQGDSLSVIVFLLDAVQSGQRSMLYPPPFTDISTKSLLSAGATLSTQKVLYVYLINYSK